MKKNIFIILAIFMGISIAANAQAPYKNGFGVTVGNMQALSFKTFASNHFAIQVDLGTKSPVRTAESKTTILFPVWTSGHWS